MKKTDIILELDGCSFTLPYDLLVSFDVQIDLIKLIGPAKLQGYAVPGSKEQAFNLVLNNGGTLTKSNAVVLIEANIVNELMWRVHGNDQTISKLWFKDRKITLVLGTIGHGFGFVDIEPSFIEECLRSNKDPYKEKDKDPYKEEEE